MSGSKWASRIVPVATFASAALRYWLSVFPRVHREARHWRVRAEAIPDPTLRGFALQAQQIKQANIEGSAAFAAFVPGALRGAVVQAQVAYQSIYDYVDTLAEQPNGNPILNGRQLHQALLAALDCDLPHADYYAYQCHRDDGGYLTEIVQACRLALSALPSYVSVVAEARQLTEHIVHYQSLNLSERQGGQRALAVWANGKTPSGTGLRWWETAASAGSSLGVFALIAAAAQPTLESSEAVAIGSVYWPWVGALHSLLDSVSDEAGDAAADHRSLLDNYTSPQEAASRLKLLAAEASRRVGALPNARQHAVILVGMVGSYLSAPAVSERSQLVSQAVLEATGYLTSPTVLVFRARRLSRHLARVHLVTPRVLRGGGSESANMAKMRSDPTDTGGLFVGRRPGTARVRFSAAPQGMSERRRRLDGSLANILLAAIVIVSLLCWGPIPLLSLWIGSQADYLSGSSNVGIVVSFAGAFLLLFGTLSVLGRLDRAWILVRRAAGHDQRVGALARIFAVAAVIGALAFAFWFLVINGPNDPNL